MVYHALAVTLSLFITYLIFYFADNGANLEFKFIDDSKSFQVISYYISGTTLLLLFYLAKCLKLFLSYRSSEFNSLLLATLTLCFCTIFGIIIPQALRVSGVHTGNSYKDVVDCIIVSAGIFSPLARLIDKNLLQALRGKKKVNREIEETIQIRNMNSFLISDILEDVQKTVVFI